MKSWRNFMTEKDYKLEIKKQNTEQRKSSNAVKIASWLVKLEKARNEYATIEVAHKEEIERIISQKQIAIEGIKAQRDISLAEKEKQIKEIEANTFIECKKLDDNKQIELAKIFERMFNTQIVNQNQKDIELYTQVSREILSLANNYAIQHEKNLKLCIEQQNKFEADSKTATGQDKAYARRKVREWEEKFDEENKKYESYQIQIVEKLSVLSQKFRNGISQLPDLIKSISNSEKINGSFSFENLPQLGN